MEPLAKNPLRLALAPAAGLFITALLWLVDGQPSTATLLALAAMTAAWSVSVARSRPMASPTEAAREIDTLMAHCGSSGLAQLATTTEQISRAQDLLNQALGHLRENFAAIAMAEPGAQGQSERLQHLEQAVIALQSEDMVGQLLEHIRRRTEQLGDVLERLGPVTRALARDVALAGRDEVRMRWIGTRLREATDALNALGRMSQPVAQQKVASGAVELF